MNGVLLDYKINQQTMILIAAKHFDYGTIVYERDKQLFSNKTPMQLIKAACLDHCSTYQGIREAVIHHTGFKRKVPIPISISKNIYTFPTHSTKAYECTWIFSDHVLSTNRIPSFDNHDAKTIITFKNLQQFALNVSQHILDKQIIRSEMCRFMFLD